MTLGVIAQAGIVAFGMSAIFLVNDPRDEVRRWGPVMGLASQPFWFYTTAVNEQWGIFACSVVYTWSWWRGFRSGWMAR